MCVENGPYVRERGNNKQSICNWGRNRQTCNHVCTVADIYYYILFIYAIGEGLREKINREDGRKRRKKGEGERAELLCNWGNRVHRFMAGQVSPPKRLHGSCHAPWSWSVCLPSHPSPPISFVFRLLGISSNGLFFPFFLLPWEVKLMEKNSITSSNQNINGWLVDLLPTQFDHVRFLGLSCKKVISCDLLVPVWIVCLWPKREEISLSCA